jgi:DNA end-binding protein Ku
MPRAIWRGAISFGMVAIPVRLYTATESKDISFRQLAEEDLKPVKYRRWSPTLERDVDYGELVRGYEYAKEQYVVLSDDDFEKLPVPTKHTITIEQFVQESEIDPIHYEKAYYLEPDEAGVKPYALLHRAMSERGLIALGKLALRQRERLVALRPQDDHLTAEMLLYPDEIRPYEGNDASGVEVSKSELDMAFALIDMLHEPFEPERFTDEYREALLDMITTKLEGGEIVVSEEAAPATETVDLMAALRASIDAARRREGGGTREQPAEEEPEEEERPKRRRSTKAAAASKSGSSKSGSSKSGSSKSGSSKSGSSKDEGSGSSGSKTTTRRKKTSSR